VYKTGLAAQKENIKYFYKKIDSTMRGNPGAEIAAMMDSLQLSHTFVVPALPLYGRTTINGNVYVKGVLLSETDYAKDPKNPVKESYIPAIISEQTDKKTGVISFDDLHAGRQQFSSKLRKMMESGFQIIVIDAEDDEDLDLTASVLATTGDRILFSGCSGLAEKLATYLTLIKEKKSNIVIAGSVNKITVNQAEFAAVELKLQIIDIDINKILAGDTEIEKRRISDLSKKGISSGDDLIIRTISPDDSVKKWIDVGKEHGLNDLLISNKIAIFLGELARELIENNKLKGIVLSGGDTAINVLQALKISGILVENEILHGIPYGHFNNEKYRDLLVVTKAGGFGEEDAIVQILNYLRNV
jgi:uncharacterized protein YgbK (DUF1537 family)